MYSFLFMVFTICLYVTGTQRKSDDNTISGNGKYCRLWVPRTYKPNMPVLFKETIKSTSIIYPEKSGEFKISPKTMFKLSCTTGRFEHFSLRNVDEVTVTCFGGEYLEYNGKAYKYGHFKCNRMPRSTIVVTGLTCKNGKNTVVKVGFQTKSKFLTLYKICFDVSTKTGLYTWSYVRWPYYNAQQMNTQRTMFNRHIPLFEYTDMNQLYTVQEQRNILTKMFKSNELANKYIQNDKKHHLIRGQYANKNDFYFVSEQSATYYNANTAPQWRIFNNNEWYLIQDAMREVMEIKKSKYLIVTGTYGVCTLSDHKGHQHPLYLEPPKNIVVPKFFWKLYYDVVKKDGIVFIGLNNPYKKIEDTDFICPDLCQYDFSKNRKENPADMNNGLIYCCTKSSFEKVYGIIDPIVFKTF